MIILFYGADSYRRLRKLEEIIQGFKKKNPTAIIDKFDLGNDEKGEFLRLKEFALNVSIFADKKLALLENVWGSEEISRRKAKKEISSSDLKELKEFLKANLSRGDLFLVISENSVPPPALDFLRKKPVSFEKFEELKGQEFKKFAGEAAKSLNINLASDALNFLAEFFDGNTWGLMTELQKIYWLKPEGEKIVVNLALLKSVGDYSESQNIFDFIGKFMYGGRGESAWDSSLTGKLIALEKLFGAREDPIKIFNILASRNLPFNLMERLANYDIMVKSGKLDYEEILLELAIS